MFQKKLNLTPLGAELPKIQVCVAIQKINSPPVNAPLPPWVMWGCLVLWLFASQTPSVVEKPFLGQSLGISVVKLLFSPLRSLRRTLRTHRAAGKAENKAGLQLLSGFGGEISPPK